MKKLILAASSLLLLSTAVSADMMDMDPKFQIGAELKAHRNTVSKNLKNVQRIDGKPLFSERSGSAGLFAGARLNEYLGAELGYAWYGSSKETVTFGGFAAASRDVKTHNMYFDVQGYLPIDSQIDLIASVGAGRLTTDMETKIAGVKSDVLSLKTTKTGLRLGFGAQYTLDNGVGVRLMARHQKGNDILKTVKSGGIALFYQFH